MELFLRIFLLTEKNSIVFLYLYRFLLPVVEFPWNLKDIKRSMKKSLRVKLLKNTTITDAIKY
jgi:hypothetical protein